MRGSDGKLCFCEKERGKLWKDHMERIMKEENDRDHDEEEDVVEGPVVCVSREEVLHALNEVKTGKSPGPSEVSIVFAAGGGVGIQVMAEICQRVLDGFVVPAEWALSIVVRIFKENCDIRYCSCYGAEKLVEHGMNVVEGCLKRLRIIVSVDEMKLGHMSERGTIAAVCIMRWMQEEYHAKGKKVLCV